VAAKAAITLTVGGKVPVSLLFDSSFRRSIFSRRVPGGSRGVTGGDFIPVFQVSTVGGRRSNHHARNLVADGESRRGMIDVGQITQWHVAANAITRAAIAAGAIWTSSLIATDVVIRGI